MKNGTKKQCGAVSTSARRRIKGFTRLETVMVLGVAGIGLVCLPALAQRSILERFYPSFLQGRENARRSACLSNLKQISLGVLQYTQDYDELLPLVASSSTIGGQTYNVYGWADAVQPYIKSTQIFQCPAEKHPGANHPDPKKAGYTDYWFNRNLARQPLAYSVSSAHSLLIGDGDGGSALSNARYNLNALPPAWAKTAHSPSRRHGDAACYAFADGHVKTILPNAIRNGPAAKTANTFSMR